MKQKKGGVTKAKTVSSKKKFGQKNRLKDSDRLQAPESVGNQFIKLQNPSDQSNSKKPNATKHQDELDMLAETDPEFYQFLQQHDANLLAFQDDDDGDNGSDNEHMFDTAGLDEEDSGDGIDIDDDGSDDSDDTDEDDVIADQRRSKNQKLRIDEKIEVSIDMVKSITAKVLECSFIPLKQLLAMFRSACIPSGALSSDSATGAVDDDGRPVGRYVVVSGEAYEQIMLSALDSVHVAFRMRLDLNENDVWDSEKLKSIDKHPKWKRMNLLIVSFFKSVTFLLDGLAESTQQSAVCIHIVDMLENYVPFLAQLPRLTKTVLKTFLKLWARQQNHISRQDTDSNTTSGSKRVREDSMGETEEVQASPLLVGGHALLRIRQMATLLPGTAAEECFRSLYLVYARQSRTFTELTAPCVTFMAQGIAEVYSTDAVLAYQQAFLYIRQLALHLRLALLKPSSDKTREITSMQFLNCLRLWTRVTCRMPSKEDGLGSLAFPLLQVMIGVISRTASGYFIPLKFHIISCMQQLAAACHMFTPTTSYVYDALESADLFGKVAPSTELAPKIESLTRFPANTLDRNVVKDLIMQEAMQLVLQDAEIYKFNAGLPEYLYLTIRRAKMFQKKCKNAKWRGMVRVVTGQLEQYASNILQIRAGPQLKGVDLREFETFRFTAPSSGSCLERLTKLSAASRLSFSGIGKVKKVLTFSESIRSASDEPLFAKNYLAVKKEQLKAAQSAAQKNKKLKDSEDMENDSNSEEEEEESNDDDDDDESIADDDFEEISPMKGRSTRSKLSKKVSVKKVPKAAQVNTVSSSALPDMEDDVGGLDDWDLND